jgi:hypothetical protein
MKVAVVYAMSVVTRSAHDESLDMLSYSIRRSLRPAFFCPKVCVYTDEMGQGSFLFGMQQPSGRFVISIYCLQRLSSSEFNPFKQ